ncbi:rhamnan synthesis F family protein [uncultured Roseobacter sp.]|uniref:rhamnan synthesis F family protein n=1 Tax=uncultured Roseobacter sp. TaxID=114847 RepID=UPI002613A37F|nr:rhamnan synthesis F family protein [uncultured Roseobacter sp.]
MAKWWKIKRELNRLGRQIGHIPVVIYEVFLAARYYDYILSRDRQIFDGQQMPSSKSAIYLIFPQFGVLKSHVRTLRYLIDKGRSVTVVCNAPISPEDREMLLHHCERLIQRPNFGYDFGGYRDGILAYQARLAEMDQLILLNDSVWFPITDDIDWLDQVDQLDRDMVGAVSNYGIDSQPAEKFRDLEFDYRTERKGFHYCSFALAFGSNVLRDRSFLRFWKWFPLSNDKRKTIRRGELGLSAWALRKGYSHASTLNVTNLHAKLADLDTERLLQVATNLMIPEDIQLSRLKKQLLPVLETLSREELISFILTGVTRQGTGYALPEFTVIEEKFPFLKKSPLWLHPEASRISLSILERLKTPASKEALEEAKEYLQPKLRTSAKP